MVVSPITLVSPSDWPAFSKSRELNGSSEFEDLRAQNSRNRLDSLLASSDFAAQLDVFMETIKLENERLMMFENKADESEKPEQVDDSKKELDFSTYQLVLEAGQKKLLRPQNPPRSSLQLLA